MGTPRFEWDDGKASANAAKHGVTVEEAKSVFADEHARLIDDPDHSDDDEDRFILLGLSSALRLLLVCHYRSEGNVVRIISARKATNRESGSYP